MLGHLPGKKGFFGTELIRELGRLHDYRLDYVRKYPEAGLLTTEGPGLNVIAYDRDSVKTILRVSVLLLGKLSSLTYDVC